MRFKAGQVLLLIFGLLTIGAPARAHALDIAVVLARGDVIHAQFGSALVTFAVRSDHRIVKIELVDGKIGAPPEQSFDLVIAAGFAATEAAIARFAGPVLATLINTRQLEVLQERHPNAMLSAILLDQPLERHVRLAHAALGRDIRLAVLLGPETHMFEDELASAAKQLGVQLVARPISTSAELLPALDRVLETSDALLTLPDPVTSSPTTARAILLSCYRQRRPVFAYSKAYVDAGALAAVYSSPADIGRDTAEWLSSLNGGATIDALPRPRAPRQFGVAVNRQVARALSLNVPDEASLLEAVRAGGAP